MLRMLLLCWLGTDLPGYKVWASASSFSIPLTMTDFAPKMWVNNAASPAIFFFSTSSAVSLRFTRKFNSYRKQHVGVASQPHSSLWCQLNWLGSSDCTSSQNSWALISTLQWLGCTVLRKTSTYFTNNVICFFVWGLNMIYLMVI